MNGDRLEALAIGQSVRQDCPMPSFLYVLALKPPLRKLRDEKTSLALRGIPFAGPLSAKVSAYADDITVFVLESREEGGCEVRADSRGQDQL